MSYCVVLCIITLRRIVLRCVVSLRIALCHVRVLDMLFRIFEILHLQNAACLALCLQRPGKTFLLPLLLFSTFTLTRNRSSVAPLTFLERGQKKKVWHHKGLVSRAEHVERFCGLSWLNDYRGTKISRVNFEETEWSECFHNICSLISYLCLNTRSLKPLEAEKLQNPAVLSFNTLYYD